MSQEAVEAILGKAVLDEAFRNALFAGPESALAAYELSEMEMASLLAIDFETLESLAGTLDDRMTRYVTTESMFSAATVGR